MLEAYDDLRVVGEVGSGDEAIVLAAATRPYVVLMDLRMPGTRHYSRETADLRPTSSVTGAQRRGPFRGNHG